MAAYGRSGKQKDSRASSASSFRRPCAESSTEDFDIRPHAGNDLRSHPRSDGRPAIAGIGDRQAADTSILKTGEDNDDQV